MTTDVRHDWGFEGFMGSEPTAAAAGHAMAWPLGGKHAGYAEAGYFEGGGYPLTGHGQDRITGGRTQPRHQRHGQNSMGDTAKRTRLDSPRQAVANSGDHGWGIRGDLVDYRAPAQSGRVLRRELGTITLIGYAIMVTVIGLCSFWTTAHFLGVLDAYEHPVISVTK